MKKNNKLMKNSQRLCRIHQLVSEWNRLTDEFCKLKREIGEELYSLGYDLGKLK